MVYIFGVIGFVFGFSIGLGIINVLLQKRSKEEIQSNRALKWIYGPVVWAIAVLGCFIALKIYENSSF